MAKRYVRVTFVGYFDIDEKDLPVYEAETFEEAVDNQRRFHLEDKIPTTFDEYVEHSLPVEARFELMHTDFTPPKFVDHS